MSIEYRYYTLGAQAILKALGRDVKDKTKEEILKIIEELIKSFEKDLEEDVDG